jgi:hypothetical protein
VWWWLTKASWFQGGYCEKWEKQLPCLSPHSWSLFLLVPFLPRRASLRELTADRFLKTRIEHYRG